MPASLYRNAVKRSICERECVEIETKTSATNVNIQWVINEDTLTIAKSSKKGDKKGVISTSVPYGIHTFTLELCVPGWRRSHEGFSAFYLTVGRKKEDIDKVTKDVDFVAKYSVEFGRSENIITRVSSIRNDFDLGVGFPHFTQTTTLINAIYQNELVFNVNVQIFKCESVTKNTLVSSNRTQSITAGLMSRMYDGRTNGDVAIIAKDHNKNNVTKRRYMRLHKCVLTASSPVLQKYFEEKQASCIVMKRWNADIIMAMIKFLYLGTIELENVENIEREDDDNEHLALDSLDCDIMVGDLSQNEEEEVKSMEKDDEIEEMKKSIKKKVSLQDMNMCSDEVLKLFGLFEIAECYNMKELLVACCRKLQCYVSLKTCCMFLVYLEKYSDIEDVQNIKLYILEYIHQNIKVVKSSSGYLYLLQNEPSLMDELIDTISVGH